KIYGEVFKDWKKIKEDELVDFASALNGAKAVLCSDMFFSHMDNLIMPGRGVNMGDGWETKRSRKEGNRDWVIIRLAHKGGINKMSAVFPVMDYDALIDAADEKWVECTEEDWLEAFSHHPKIGNVDALKEKFADTAEWASGEQAGVQTATENIIHALSKANSE